MHTLRPIAITVAAVALQCVGFAAHAQLMDSIKGKLGDSLPSMTGGATSGSLGNVAGVLQYCAKNNYLKGQDASSVKDQLMSKLSGNKTAADDKGYADGLKGILTAPGGSKTELGGSGSLKEQITEKACDAVLKQGKSLL
jgi:hypothetical protein